MSGSPPSIDAFAADAQAWLSSQLPRRTERAGGWGVGSDAVSLFRSLDEADEAVFVAEGREWQRRKFDAGYAAISWSEEFGGRGLPREFERTFARLEAKYDVPDQHECITISVDIVAPTILEWGSDEQRAVHLPKILRGDEIWCQLFSEPGAGSDLRSLTAAARPSDHGGWELTGEKVWTSGAPHASFGYVLCRTDAPCSEQDGITAFIVDMSVPGVEVRPLRQMTGGSSFSQVHFQEVRLLTTDVIGTVGRGWDVARTTMRHERGAFSSSIGGPVPGLLGRLIDLARHAGLIADPNVRQRLAQLYIERRVQGFTARRAVAKHRAGQAAGPIGSVGKLQWTEGLRKASDLAGMLLGPRLLADTDEWGTFAWAEFVTGVPGYRIAGGTDEIQRNALAERFLELPREPIDAARRLPTQHSR